MSPGNEDLDHDTESTDTLVKSVNPDSDFLKSEQLCRRCHGALRVCDKEDCPQK